MPILNVNVGAARSDELTRRITHLLLELTTRVLRKDPDVTVIAINYLDPRDWVVGGRSLADHGKAGFYFDVKITDETNTKEEKANYIEQAFGGLTEILGDVHEESYVFVHDVRATAYGYGGRTQEHRFQHA